MSSHSHLVAPGCPPEIHSAIAQRYRKLAAVRYYTAILMQGASTRKYLEDGIAYYPESAATEYLNDAIEAQADDNLRQAEKFIEWAKAHEEAIPPVSRP